MRYAAVDIGSNSIRMLAAEVHPGEPPQVLAADREVTRLGESVFREGAISPRSLEEISRVLARMSDVYARLKVAGVRAVATSAVRDAANQQEFLDRAGIALGAPIEIVSGREEARLIHRGVVSQWPHHDQRLLIADIGGGSAEIISSHDDRLADAVSKPLGALRLTEMFLHADPPAPRELQQLNEFVDAKLDAAVERMGMKWDRAIATSATAAAIVCTINRVSRARREQADRLHATTAQVRALYREIVARDLQGRRKIAGIGPRRAEIIVAGTATLLRILERFQIRKVYYSSAGVRDGIIADLAARGVGGEAARLTRDQRREVERVASRFGVKVKHAHQVAGFARLLFHRMLALHQLPLAYGRLLEAAAYLCDTGHYISDSGHHKHAYYVIANADLSGFTVREREFIANLCRYHRKAMPSLAHSSYQAMPPEDRRALMLLIPILRLADNLDRTREQNVELESCEIRPGVVVVNLRSSHAPELTEWAAAKVSEVFRNVYSLDVSVTQDRA
jgi:exopolyphosphatase/guanosine-5'-triphosphate,3'-diphosphate pyrophosphatase